MNERDSSAIIVDEQALRFRSEGDYQAVIEVVAELSKAEGRQLPFRPLGGMEDLMAIVRNDAMPQLTARLDDLSIPYESLPVESISKLTRTERRILKQTGRKLG